ncbi:type II secretion system F family protein [Halarchaeum sp. CBA1220]|uniref:type II secretion system F family protein n=1 Tax=Halarchaeum sp. CBA1220 TaxID=1853682 RepID=UPI000F3AA2CF|nr:type II secretion system F family protein [Halarchaeum sp. CBA1220]QLC33711.1 type II secretion system F family protein [Halarchaeum sp. CBA1220]
MSRQFDALDRACYALFGERAATPRHDRDRQHYRATTVRAGFDVYLARVYALATLLGFLTGALSAGALLVLAGTLLESLPVPPLAVALPVGLVVGVLAGDTTIRAGGRYLQLQARARRADIERTLPGAVRYLRVLASGGADERTLVQRVAERPDAFGETAVEFRAVHSRTALTGSIDEALRGVARDTPSRDLLAPFLLKFREHAQQGPDAVESYLELEARMLANRQSRADREAAGVLELLAELFVVLLVVPVLLVIVVTVLGVLAPSLGRTVPTVVGPVTLRALVVYGCAACAVVVGAGAATLVDSLRPAGYGLDWYARSADLPGVVRGALDNPADAIVALPVIGVLVGVALWLAGVDAVSSALLGYAAGAVPVGLVAVRRARRDDAKDREIKDFVHGVAGYVGLGNPLPRAVDAVARDGHLGPLKADVADLSFNLGLTAYGDEVRREALARFTSKVGTPLADQSIGLVTGALDTGSDAETAFEALQTEIGRLYDERKGLRSQLQIYVAVGWTTALLVVGIVVVVNAYVLGSFAQLAAVHGVGASLAIDPGAVDPERDRYRFYVVTQATMLACGWFAGAASRGRYEALLHSGALVALTYAVFALTGMMG